MSTGRRSISSTRTDLRKRQTAFAALRIAGGVTAAAGCAAIAYGAVLPWARFTVFGVDLTAPGVTGWGALSLSAALVALVSGRRFPLLGLLLGLLALGIGNQAQRETGRILKGRVLGLQQALVPVNDKLMRVGLPPIEPFPLGRPWRDYLGPGPLWTFWGGTLLAVGSAAIFAGDRLGRSCPRCGAQWRRARAGTVVFCPACGEPVAPLAACPACLAPAEPGDHFCTACGVALSS